MHAAGARGEKSDMDCEEGAAASNLIEHLNINKLEASLTLTMAQCGIK